MKRLSTPCNGSTLLAAAMSIAIGAMVIAAFYKTLIPKYRSIHQSASWQDALQGAESGVNHTLALLDQFTNSTPDPDGYPWTGAGWTFTDPLYTLNGERTLAPNLLPVLGGQNDVAVTKVAVDVYTRSEAIPYSPWFRIRSTARASLPGRFTSEDKRDAALRRMKLGAKKNGIDDPHVTRTVEVLVKPRFRFNNAIATVFDLSLGNSKNWLVDSFDSSDSTKSDPGTIAGGIYPSSAAKRQSNGNIASMKSRPENSPYGALIEGNGAVVEGDVRTNGGDNPTTTVHENVSGSSGMTQDRIFDDFDQDFPAVAKPAWSLSDVLLTPPGKTGFSTGTKSAPNRYIVAGGLGAFKVLAPPAGTVGYVEILVNGKLDIGNGNGAEIVIPPNVSARLYVDGNIEFGNGDVNSNSASSKVASRLAIYGVSTGSNATFTASGNPDLILTFYGPNYAITLSGNVTTIGAMVGKSFEINGGGNGGFHYDEALGRGGDIAGWEVASYFEDSRAEL